MQLVGIHSVTRFILLQITTGFGKEIKFCSPKTTQCLLTIAKKGVNKENRWEVNQATIKKKKKESPLQFSEFGP